LRNLLFGSIPDQVTDGADYSVLMVRKYEPAPVSWLRRTIKRYESTNNSRVSVDPNSHNRGTAGATISLMQP